MENKKQIVANLIGGPGVGKSIITGDLFSAFKRKGISCDVSREFIKGLIYEGSKKGIQSQNYIFGNQEFEQFKLIGEVDVVVTDCPLLLSVIYDSGKNPHFKPYVLHEFNNYDNIVFHINRNLNVPYEEKGRFQDLDGAKMVDERVLNFLKSENIPYINVYGIDKDVQEFIVNTIENKLNSVSA